MKKRLILAMWLILSGLITLLPYINAESYSGDHFNGEMMGFMGINYTILGDNPTNQYEQNYTRVVFRRMNPADLIYVTLGKCYERGFYEYCYDGQYYDWDTEYTYKNPFGRVEPKMQLRINYKMPDISIEGASDIKVKYDASELIEIKLRNTGSKDAIVDYYEYLPAEIYAYNCDGCTLAGNKISKHAIIYNGTEISFTYIIRKKDYDESSWISYYSYNYNEETFTGSSNVKITIDKPYELSESLSASTGNELPKSFDYTFTLKNLEDSPMQAKIIFNLKDFETVFYDDWQKNGNIYIIERQIMPTSEMTYKLRLKPLLIGANTILQDFYLTINSLGFNISKNQTYTVSSDALTLDILMDSEFYVPGEIISADIKLANPDKRTIYYNIFGTIRGIAEDYFTHPSMNTNQVLLIQKNYTAQYNTSINITLLYRSETGQEFRITANKPIIVEGGTAPPVQEPAATDISGNDPSQQADIPPAATEAAPDPAPEAPPETIPQESAENSNNQDIVDKGSDWLSRLFDDINRLFEKIFSIKKKK